MRSTMGVKELIGTNRQIPNTVDYLGFFPSIQVQPFQA